MTTANQVLSEVEYDVVGKRPVRPDGVDKVTGRAQYGADLELTGLLHARVLRSPHAHARITSIDTSKAEALSGVRAVVTAADLPFATLSKEDLGNDYNRFKFLSDNFLASDKALYRGHAVAAVAADNAHIAEAALALIDVDYEVLEPVIDVRAAMQDGAPLIHGDLIHTSAMGEISDKPSNVASYMKFEKGDTAAGFANSDVVVEREFTTASVHQGYIEPHNATAHWRADGQINIWCSTQGAFVVRANTADVLRVDVSDIRVTPMEIGGGFGGKVSFYLEPVAALLSRKAGAPVQVLMSRTEVFEGSGPAPGSWMRVKMGANSAGKITAAEIELAFEAGAYPGSPVMQGATCAFACYELENGTVEGYDVVVNKPKTAAYRAPGSPQAAFGVEQVVDELCQKLGVDPVEFRLNNAVTEGSRKVEGPVFQKIGLVECLEATRNHEHYRTPLEGPNRGRGIAAGFWMNRGFHSSVNMTVNPDGTVNLIEGSVDIGGSRASIAQQAAETLGIAYDDIKPQVVDTDSIGFTMVTGGSRTTFATGWAAILAAEDVKQQMVERAASIWDVPAEDVEYDGGVIRHKSEELSFTFQDLARQLYTTGGGITGTASLDPTGEGNSFGVHLVDVEVDPETGKTEILRYTAIQDAGKAVHPSYVEGQIQGGAVQGIGWALNEEYYFSNDGQMMNSSFLDYRMPTSLDLPMIDTVIVEVANPGHPYGVRGVGEVPIVPPLAAIANAVGHATDQRLTSLPITPGSVLEASL
ncbi:MAG: xanthine dehydrogenase family protein molybdopterin-binding subunit [Chloroflexota bacterium]|nr:xanthine dehydrogenase family protein molybdopterin-binding subunit [Chloroflexota bacterium]MDE2961324.1 xanthine dehydrogenase family protein molybdopterin-binding subunit [Chloroflexota bacterium]